MFTYKSVSSASHLCRFHSTEELKRQASSLEASQVELRQVQAQLAEARAEMENIKAVATVSESTKQEAIDQVKQQWQEEVASLQAIMKGSIQSWLLMPLMHNVMCSV